MKKEFYATEQEMYDYARDKSLRVEIRSYDEHGNSSDIWRNARQEESDMIEAAIYAALLSIRDGYDSASAKSTAEYFIHINPISKTADGCINAYGSVWIPIDEFERMKCNEEKN